MATIKMWFAMKRKEIEFKFMFYTYGIRFMDEKYDLINMINNIYRILKETPINELRDQFITELAYLAHEQAQKEMNDAE